MAFVILAVVVVVGAIAATGFLTGWRLAAWGLALAIVGWAVFASAGLHQLGAPPPGLQDYEYEVMHALQRRNMTYVVVLATESIFAAVVLSIAGWPAARRHAVAALCLSALFAGMLASFARRH